MKSTLVASLAFSLSFISAAHAQSPASLDMQGAAREGSLSFTGEQITAQITAGGPIDASNLNAGEESCVGYVNARPNVIIRVTRDTALQLVVAAGADTTLVVAAPSGRMFCNDDAEGLNPGLTTSAETGAFRIWVGAFEGADESLGMLTVATAGATVQGTSAATPTFRGSYSGSALTRTMTVGGTVAASSMKPGCQGSVSQEPSAMITVAEAGMLRVAFASDSDTTLVVRTPSGALLCNDDADGQNPAVVLPSEAGAFQIWAGSYSGGLSTGTLTVTESTPTVRTLQAMPEPAQRNRNLERNILRSVQSAGWTETPVFAFLSSREWRYRRSPTGRVTGRYRGAWIGATWPDGHCSVQEFDFIQEGVGRRFTGSLRTYTTGSQRDVDCDALRRMRRRLRR